MEIKKKKKSHKLKKIKKRKRKKFAEPLYEKKKKTVMKTKYGGSGWTAEC